MSESQESHKYHSLKQKLLKTALEKKMHYIQKNNNTNEDILLIRNNGNQRQRSTIFKVLKIKPSILKSVSYKVIFFKKKIWQNMIFSANES